MANLLNGFINTNGIADIYNKFITLMISSVNVIKSAVSGGFGHIYRRNP